MTSIFKKYELDIGYGNILLFLGRIMVLWVSRITSLFLGEAYWSVLGVKDHICTLVSKKIGYMYTCIQGEVIRSRVRIITQILSLNYLSLNSHSHYTSACLVSPLCYVPSYYTKQYLCLREWGSQWKTWHWPFALQKLTTLLGNTNFICNIKQYLTNLVEHK